MPGRWHLRAGDAVRRRRLLWLSGGPLDERVRMLKELTEPAQTTFFARRWRVASKVPGEIARLRKMLDGLEG